LNASHEAIVARATIEVKRVADVDRDALLAVVERHGFARVTGLVGRDEMRACVAKMKERFDPALDRATTGEKPDEVRRHFQKWSIGRGPHGQTNRPRMMRTFYDPLWEEDVYGLHSAFRRQCGLRNLLGRLPDGYAIDAPADGLFTASRIHHYPSGGGFMVGHVDSIIPAVYAGADLDFHHTLLLITEKGEDFETGGGFIETGGEHIVYEDHCHAGDVIVYDHRLVHGVDDVDPTVPFRQASLAGRMSGFVSFYREI